MINVRCIRASSGAHRVPNELSTLLPIGAQPGRQCGDRGGPRLAVGVGTRPRRRRPFGCAARLGTIVHELYENEYRPRSGVGGASGLGEFPDHGGRHGARRQPDPRRRRGRWRRYRRASRTRTFVTGTVPTRNRDCAPSAGRSRHHHGRATDGGGHAQRGAGGHDPPARQTLLHLKRPTISARPLRRSPQHRLTASTPVDPPGPAATGAATIVQGLPTAISFTGQNPLTGAPIVRLDGELG